MHGVETRFSSLTFISKVNIAVGYILPTFLFLLLLFLLLLLVLPGTTIHTPVPITSLYSYKKLSTQASTECLQHTCFHWMFITHLGDIGIASVSILQVAKLAEKISKFPKRWKQLAIIWMQVFFLCQVTKFKMILLQWKEPTFQSHKLPCCVHSAIFLTQ